MATVFCVRLENAAYSDGGQAGFQAAFTVKFAVRVYNRCFVADTLTKIVLAICPVFFPDFSVICGAVSY